MADPFETPLDTVEELRELYPPVLERAVRKDIGYLDDLCRRLIGGASIVFLATHSAEGHADVTPRGGQAGFVTVLDDHRLAIPDATGNQRLDTLANVVDSGRIGMIFVIGGRDTTLRVNGRACVSADPELLERLEPVGKPPRTAIVIEARRSTRTARRRSCAPSCGIRSPGRSPARCPPPPR